jgi:riboflavin biosynthesis pyrimidine reductase
MIDTGELTTARLRSTYRFPARLDRPWVQVNFVSSADGACEVSGDSEFLSDPLDQEVLAAARNTADVVLVGARTAVAGNYQSIPTDPACRISEGLTARPALAVVSGRCSLPPESPLFADPELRPTVFTCEAAPGEQRRALLRAGVDVISAGEDRVDLDVVLAELDRRGHRRIDCEGGPHLFASLIEACLVDELRLTVAPQLVGGHGGRVAAGSVPAQRIPLQLISVMHGGGAAFLRYVRALDPVETAS